MVNGVLTYGKSDKYERDFYDGDFKDDRRRHGKGKLICKNGDEFKGEWKDNTKNGFGILVYSAADALEKYEGSWVDGEQSGEGKLYWKDGAKSEFEKFIGNFDKDKFSGSGELYCKNGDKFVGQFKDNIKHGEGTLYSSNDEIKQQGVWESDRYVGSSSSLTTTNQI